MAESEDKKTRPITECRKENAPASQDDRLPSAQVGTSTFYRQVLEVLHHAVMVVTPDKRILFANQAMCQYLGMVTGRKWTPEELEGMDVMDFHPPSSVEGTNRRFAEMAGTGYLAPRTNPIEDVMFMTWDSRLCGEDGEILGYVLEKIPASFNPSPMPKKSVDSLVHVREKFEDR